MIPTRTFSRRLFPRTLSDRRPADACHDVDRARRRAASRPRSPLVRRLAALLVVPLALAGCTNSKLILGPLYNRLDDQMRKEFEKLGDFDEKQTALFEAAVGTGHVWHRQHELPAYARLIDEVAGSVAIPGATTRGDVARWSETIEQHAMAARECHPVNFSFDLMKSLSDKEIDFIERRFARERKKNRERYFSRTAEERVDYRLKNARKWAGRLGIEFTGEQNAMLRSAFTRQTSLKREYYLLADRWNAEFFRLAREQDAPDYDARVAAKLSELWTLLEKGYPEEWEANRRLWRDVVQRFITSMTPRQRTKLSSWMAKMADTVTAISRDEPSFKPGTDPSVGCLVDTASLDTGAGAPPGGGTSVG